MSKRSQFFLFLLVAILLASIMSLLFKTAYPVVAWKNYIKIILVISFISGIGYILTLVFAKKVGKTVAGVLGTRIIEDIKKGLTTMEGHPRFSQFEIKSMETLVKRSLEKDLRKALKEHLLLFYLLTIIIIIMTFFLIRLMMAIPPIQ